MNLDNIKDCDVKKFCKLIVDSEELTLEQKLDIGLIISSYIWFIKIGEVLGDDISNDL